MKKSRRVISLILCLVMTLTTFCGVGVLPSIQADAADINIEGVSQTRVVGTDGSYALTYAEYAADYLNGAAEPTDIVIPGMDPAQNYIVQGMSYWPAKDWMLITVYHNGSESSKIFAIDAKTGKFRAMFDFLNVDGTVNTDHGGGIAVSEHNFYYSCNDTDRKIAYAPISAFNIAENETYKRIQLVAEKDFAEIGSVDKDSKTAYSAYVCYDQGILWTGNFYDEGTSVVGVAVAQGYNAPATSKYNSMVWGYELSGSTSEEEWENLTSATATSDCQGSPSYAIALNNSIKDVQYAVVDNGKLYLSRSYGSGAGNSVSFGFGETSKLTIADIDLTVPGTGSVDIRLGDGSTKTINDVYVIDNYNDYDMMPMSEGLCVIDDYVYITFESASNKYRNESSGVTSIGNCEKPVDVVWRLDQYELMGQERENEEKTLYYEKVDKLADIKDGEEYIIFHESAEKDSFTQKNWLYMFDSFGGYKGNKMSKYSAANTKGYVGMIGYPVIDYSLDGNKLYFTNPDKDDVNNIHWEISGANSGNLRIKNGDNFYSTYRNLYIDKERIALASNDVSTLGSMKIVEAPASSNGGFYIMGADDTYLWCNDGVTGNDNGSYTDQINNYYKNSTVAMYQGLTEKSGTFHPDALGTTNIIGGSIATRNDYEDGIFYIYRRVVDEYASTQDSRIYTDMEAQLQADGTYTVNLETYATGEMQYQVLDSKRPTDYLFVLDASHSMTKNSDCSGYQQYGSSNTLNAYAVAGDTTDICNKDNRPDGMTGDIYIRYNDKMCRATVYSGNYSGGTLKTSYQRIWLSIDCDGVTYWWVPTAFNDASKGGSWSTTKPSSSETMEVTAKWSDTGPESTRAKSTIYIGEHYKYTSSTGCDRYSCMKTSFDVLSKKIATESPDSRIALVQFGSDSNENWDNTGMYTNSSKTMVQYTGAGSISEDSYKNVFYTSDKFEQCRDIVWNMSMPNSPDTYVNYGLDMVQGIIDASGKDYYTAGGQRNLAVIVLTDGIPGLGTENMTVANNIAETAVQNAYNLKKAGASIYTLQMGNSSTTDFSMQLYLNAVSSNYPEAKSRTNLGLKNNNGVDYSINVTLGSEKLFETMANEVFTTVEKAATFGLTNLTQESVLRAKLSDAFIVPEDFDGNITATIVPGNYDVCGRLTWGMPANATGVTLSRVSSTGAKSSGNDTLLVTGYNYSEQYIARKHNGNKLVITITGLCANPAADIENTSINDPSVTAIYQDSEFAERGQAAKYFPTEYFTIPVYDYNLDFGLSVQNSTGKTGAKFLAVSETLGKQDTSNYLKKSKTGKMELLNDTTFVGHIDPGTFDENGYVLWQTASGTYEWLGINLNPASNILYEENIFTDKTTSGVSWTNDGTALKVYQKTPDNNNEVYGYDDAYADNTNHSNGTVLKASVDSSNKRTNTETFKFTGDSFDLISACGKNTGVLLVNIRNSAGKLVKGYVVDTYYRDTTNLADNGLLCQTPVVKFSGTYDTYTVEVTGAYLSNAGAANAAAISTFSVNGVSAYSAPAEDNSLEAMLTEIGMEEMISDDVDLVWFDSNSVLNGGTGAASSAKPKSRSRVATFAADSTTALNCYIDGVRVYNSLQDTSAYAWSEQQPTYYNVIDNLVSGNFTSDSAIDGFAFVESPGAGSALSFATYQNNGPTDEFYLNKAGEGVSALAFKVKCGGSDSRVMISLRSVSGKPVEVQIGSLTFTVSTPTEMYYDITEAVTIGADNYATVTVKNNTADCALAVNNIKVTEASITGISMADGPEFYSLMTAEAQPAKVVNGVVKAVDDTQEPETPDDSTGSDTGSTFDIITMIINIIKQVFESLFKTISLGEVK